MATRRDVREAVKTELESDYPFPIFTSRVIDCQNHNLYAAIVIPEGQATQIFISEPYKLEYQAELQIVLYMRKLDEEELDTLADDIVLKLLQSTQLNALLESLSYQGFEYIDESQGYHPLALRFGITYRQ